MLNFFKCVPDVYILRQSEQLIGLGAEILSVCSYWYLLLCAAWRHVCYYSSLIQNNFHLMLQFRFVGLLSHVVC